jgi:hypothetical protein
MGSPPPFSSPRSGHGGSGRRYERERYESGMTSPLSARRYRPETPSSLRSGSVVRQEYLHESGHSRSGTPEQATPQRTGPLVLLHITLLPCSSPPYSARSMTEIAPGYITENWRLLQEKLTDTVLERGLLISHPGEEFDLLEERVLETLDLCPPRITSCGHYYGGDLDSDSGNDSGVSDLSRDEREVRAICSTPHEEQDEEDVCRQCDQHMRLPGKGIGAGTRKWNVKIFAANGLMKASAWTAACSDMERVDVEIEPWMPEDVKRALDLRLEEEEEEERKQADQVEHLKFELGEMERLRLEAEAARLRAEGDAKEMEALRREAEAAKLRTEEYAKERERLRLEAEAAKLRAEEYAEAAKLKVEEHAEEGERLRVEAEAAKLRAEECAEAAKFKIEERAKELEVLRREAEATKLRTEEDAKERERLRVEAEAAKLRAEECAEAAILRAEERAKEMDEELKRMSAAHLQASLEMDKESKRVDATQIQASTEVDKELEEAIEDPGLELPEQKPIAPIPPNTRSKGPDVQSKDIPLSTLLYNYLYLLAQDRRNLVLGFLSILVLFLSYNLVAQKTIPNTIPSLLTSQEILRPSSQISLSSSTTSPAVTLSSASSPAAILQASAPESQSTAPVPQSSAMTESTSSSTSVYSPPAAPASSHLPRHDPKLPEKEAEPKPETSLKPPHSESVSVQHAFPSPTLTATCSTSPIKSKQPRPIALTSPRYDETKDFCAMVGAEVL